MGPPAVVTEGCVEKGIGIGGSARPLPLFDEDSPIVLAADRCTGIAATATGEVPGVMKRSGTVGTLLAAADIKDVCCETTRCDDRPDLGLVDEFESVSGACCLILCLASLLDWPGIPTESDAT